MRHAPPRRPRLWVPLFLVSGLAVGCVAGPAPARSPASVPGLFVGAYHPWWAPGAGEGYPWESLDALYFFELEVGGGGEITQRRGWPDAWRLLREEARRRDVQVIPTLTMHEEGAFEAVFGDPVRRDRLVTELEALLRADPSIRGLHLDFEHFQPVSQEVRQGFTAFVARLREALSALDPGLGLSLFTLAFDDDDVYDEAALAPLADYLVVQGYDLHYAQGDRAGPTAATRGWGRLNWPGILARYDALGIPRGKLVMGIPLYGYEWPTEGADPGSATRGDGVTVPLEAPEGVLPRAPRGMDRVRRHGSSRDGESGAPYYVFQDEEGGWVQGWLEDATTLDEKYAFIRTEGLGGMAFFTAAYGTPEVWAQLRTTLGGGSP